MKHAKNKARTQAVQDSVQPMARTDDEAVATGWGHFWGRLRGWCMRSLRPAARKAPPQGGGRKVSTLAGTEVGLVLRDLRVVLDRHPNARHVMPYVRALERGLSKKGRHALDALPIEVLRRAMSQLERFVADWRPEGLQLLRSKAALAIAERERVSDIGRAARQRAQHDDVQVGEASVTTFMAANEEWERSFTGQTGAVPLDEAAAPESAASAASAEATARPAAHTASP